MIQPPSQFPSHSGAFTRRTWMLVGTAIVCLFLPTLFHPLGPDQSFFNLNGIMLLKGKVYYRDMVDMKPPLISFMYAAANFLFSSGDHSMRILDLLLQGATCWMIAAVIRRAGLGDLTAAVSAICYALIYTSQRYSDPAQAESYIGLFGFGILWLLLRDTGAARFFAIGLLGGVLAMLKFPFAILLLVVPFADRWLHRRSMGAIAAHVLITGAGFAVVAGLFFLYLFINGAYDDLLLVMEFTRGYAMTELRSLQQWLTNLVTVLPYHLLTDLSPLFLIAIIVGTVRAWRGRTAAVPEPGRVLLRLCTLAFLLMLVTIVAEGKYPHYHFARLFPFGAVLAGYGLLWLAGRLGIPADGSKTAQRARGWKLALGVAVLLILGPFPSYGWRTAFPVAYRLLHTGTAEEFARYDASVRETRTVGRYIQEREQPGDQLFVAASIGGQVYMQAGLRPMTPIYHFAFVSEAYGARLWSDSVRHYVMGSRPRFIVAETTDSYPSIVASTLTSDQRLRGFPEVDSLLRAAYTDTLRLEHLVVYERKGG